MNRYNLTDFEWRVAEGSAIIGPVMYEVVEPDMVRPLGAQPDTGAIVEP